MRLKLDVSAAVRASDLFGRIWLCPLISACPKFPRKHVESSNLQHAQRRRRVLFPTRLGAGAKCPNCLVPGVALLCASPKAEMAPRIPGFWQSDINISLANNRIASITVESNINPAYLCRKAVRLNVEERIRRLWMRCQRPQSAAEEATANYQIGPERLLECRGESGVDAKKTGSYRELERNPRAVTR